MVTPRQKPRSKSLQLVLTCEHGGNTIPTPYRKWFADAKETLQTHRGYDPGALELAKQLAKSLSAPLTFETRSRLLIELNRSLHHPRLFSEFSWPLPEAMRQHLINTIYVPYRKAVTDQLKDAVKQGPVVHLSVHSFTPVMNGKTRRTEIGLLFDPSREFETAFCEQWRKQLNHTAPDLKVHFNLPYRGTSDGFTTSLREQFPSQAYAGIELEVNQKFPLGPVAEWKRIQQILKTTLSNAIQGLCVNE